MKGLSTEINTAFNVISSDLCNFALANSVGRGTSARKRVRLHQKGQSRTASRSAWHGQLQVNILCRQELFPTQ